MKQEQTLYRMMIITMISIISTILASCDSTNGESVDTPNLVVQSYVTVTGTFEVNQPITITVEGMPPEFSYGFKVMPKYELDSNFEISGKTVVHKYNKPGTYLIYGAGQNVKEGWAKTYMSMKVTIQ